MEKTLNVKINIQLHNQMKANAALMGISVKEYIEILIKKDLETKKDIR